MRLSLTSRPVAAFPNVPAGRLPHSRFRGLLSVHSRCGPHGRWITLGDPLHRSASNDVVTSIIRSDCYRLERQFAGRDSHPLRDGAFPRHTVRNQETVSVERCGCTSCPGFSGAHVGEPRSRRTQNKESNMTNQPAVDGNELRKLVCGHAESSRCIDWEVFPFLGVGQYGTPYHCAECGLPVPDPAPPPTFGDHLATGLLITYKAHLRCGHETQSSSRARRRPRIDGQADGNVVSGPPEPQFPAASSRKVSLVRNQDRACKRFLHCLVVRVGACALHFVWSLGDAGNRGSLYVGQGIGGSRIAGGASCCEEYRQHSRFIAILTGHFSEVDHAFRCEADYYSERSDAGVGL